MVGGVCRGCRKIGKMQRGGLGGGRFGSRLSQVGVNVPIPAPRPHGVPDFCHIAQLAYSSGSAADVLLHGEQEVDPGRPELLREGRA